MSTNAEVHVSMLPDLSKSIPNEQTAWEQIMQIKELPISMIEKKRMKSEIQVSFFFFKLFCSYFKFIIQHKRN